MATFDLNKLYRKLFPCFLSWFVVLRLISAGENLTDAKRTVTCLENDSDVVLECGIYINNKSRLASIKWFKNRKEFFSYYPSIKSSDQPEINYYEDVGVDKSRSQKDRLYMKPIKELHRGTYRCAVQEHSVDGNFIDHYRDIDLQIIYFPKNKPTLVIHKNDKSRYKVGDELSFKCSITVLKMSNITMDWYVRGKSVSKDMCSFNETYVTNSHKSVWSIFVYKIEEQLTFRGKIPVKCLIRIPSLYWQTSEIIIYVGDKSAGNKMCITNYFVVLTLASLIYSYLFPAVFK